jgi:hypothetical protein
MGQELIMAESSLLLDTVVLVDFLRGQREAVAFVTARSTRIILSSIVVAELYAGIRGAGEEAALEELVSIFRVVPVSGEIAKKGGLYERDYGKSHGVGLADAILAATAEAENAELKTLSTKRYPMLKGLRPAYTKEKTLRKPSGRGLESACNRRGPRSLRNPFN